MPSQRTATSPTNSTHDVLTRARQYLSPSAIPEPRHAPSLIRRWMEGNIRWLDRRIEERSAQLDGHLRQQDELQTQLLSIDWSFDLGAAETLGRRLAYRQQQLVFEIGDLAALIDERDKLRRDLELHTCGDVGDVAD